MWRKKTWCRVHCLLLLLFPPFKANCYHSSSHFLSSAQHPRNHHPEQAWSTAETTKLCLWAALLRGSGLHDDFFLPSCLGWSLCSEMSSGAFLDWSQHFLVCNNLLHSFFIFLISEIVHLRFCKHFSKFNSQFLADAYVPSHYFRSPPYTLSHESQKMKLLCFFKEKKNISSNCSSSLQNSLIWIFI